MKKLNKLSMIRSLVVVMIGLALPANMIFAGLDHSSAQNCNDITGPTQSCSYTISPEFATATPLAGTYTWTADTEPCDQVRSRLASGLGEWVADTAKKCGEATYAPPTLCAAVPKKLACGSSAAKVKASLPE